ncbi:MAG: PIN domain-containing protein [Gammaproteobacteria bacterium]|nr:PIN domain-containing protein [Gammaproteobacteria bacterium]
MTTNKPSATAGDNAIGADEVLVFDTSAFIAEIGLMSQKGSALKHYLYCRGTRLVVPQAAAEEYERNLTSQANVKVEQIEKNRRWLAQFLRGGSGWSAPDEHSIRARARELASGADLGAVYVPETDDARARAEERNRAERPPSHLKAGIGDCRIWEQCLELLADYDVVFVATDKDFRSHQNQNGLHPVLRAESDAVGAGRKLTFHRDVRSLLQELRSEIPPIPNETIFEFIYDAMRERVQELASDSECQPTSTGTIEQTRFTTDAREIIEVRLEMTDTWKNADGTISLPFELSGSCQYHLDSRQLGELRTEVVTLSTTEPNGSRRAVKGSHVSLSAHFYAGPRPIQPEPGILE